MTSNYEFKVPASISDRFNVVTATAVPLYAGDAKSPEGLMSVADTLTGLAAPGYAKANRAAMYLSELDDYVVGAPTAGDPEMRTAMDIIEGKWNGGLGLAALKVEDGGKVGYLYAIEDQKSDRLLVVGKQAIDAGLAADLKKNGVTYVQAETPRAAFQVNDFLATVAYLRGPGGMKFDANTVIRSLVGGFAAVCALAEPGADLKFPESTTVGAVMTASTPAPDVYVSIMKPKF